MGRYPLWKWECSHEEEKLSEEKAISGHLFIFDGAGVPVAILSCADDRNQTGFTRAGLF